MAPRRQTATRTEVGGASRTLRWRSAAAQRRAVGVWATAASTGDLRPAHLGSGEAEGLRVGHGPGEGNSEGPSRLDGGAGPQENRATACAAGGVEEGHRPLGPLEHRYVAGAPGEQLRYSRIRVREVPTPFTRCGDGGAVGSVGEVVNARRVSRKGGTPDGCESEQGWQRLAL